MVSPGRFAPTTPRLGRTLRKRTRPKTPNATIPPAVLRFRAPRRRTRALQDQWRELLDAEARLRTRIQREQTAHLPHDRLDALLDQLVDTLARLERLASDQGVK